MIYYVNAGGEERPVSFGMNALRIFSEKYGFGLNDFEQLGFHQLCGLFYIAFDLGAKKEGKKLEADIDEVSDWFDEPGVFNDLQERFAKSLEALAPGNAKRPKPKAARAKK